MRIKTVKVSGKGQISLPVEVRNAAGIEKGDELILIQQGKKILLEPVQRVSGKMADDFSDLLSLSEKSLAQVWSDSDSIWEEYVK